jgi:uracil-DNA glycosylase
MVDRLTRLVSIFETLGRGVTDLPSSSIREIGRGWGEVLAARLGESECRKLECFLAAARAPGQPPVYPRRGQVFRAFEMTRLADVRAVILGQDPYPNGDQACGLAFSVPASLPKGVRRPPSLGRILAEARRDGIQAPPGATLENWTRHVLLLNSSLTFQRGESPRHRDAWKLFTEAVIELLVETSDAVFLLWGVRAQEFGCGLKIPPERMVCSPHPMARGKAAPFAGSHPFSHANLLLTADRQIDWSLET